ncbi:copper chaperone CopZ [Staphylococcus simiae]|uniref:Copper chaperone CopZ n=1 Tax=Staphylococcus simiae CCM 7213 = CCUG 51256 TaxID=911238 RepID=G5JK60_9STAP|nr:copper chaperone CopZ [Staphylococcus simiae]EHJ07390.1 copper ion binding protein [Staphylococcus simiae CCM 7213 = CCUG 51256]PNZ09471.1 copper chaperone [Staphylococcus simiae]SNV54494.1 CopZ [Staphylococcus simiae]
MEKDVIKVLGMSCGHCKSSVESALNELNGVDSADVDLAKSEVSVQFDSNKVGFNDFKEAIENQGYEVEM